MVQNLDEKWEKARQSYKRTETLWFITLGLSVFSMIGLITSGIIEHNISAMVFFVLSLAGYLSLRKFGKSLDNLQFEIKTLEPYSNSTSKEF